mmetsp:Transcript_150952/g.485109  ORF Transcript_150952/g.485109 Transcript_150952/m.485109 type:complete len:126 (+) Transcript_150952:1-378(+)
MQGPPRPNEGAGAERAACRYAAAIGSSARAPPAVPSTWRLVPPAPPLPRASSELCHGPALRIEADAETPRPSQGPSSADPRAPPLPPGECWVRYTDKGVLWWYYEGPLGKWWMSVGDTSPIPWHD